LTYKAADVKGKGWNNFGRRKEGSTSGKKEEAILSGNKTT